MSFRSFLIGGSSIVFAGALAACTATHRDGDGDAGSSSDAGYSGLRCERRAELAVQQVASAVASADTRCATDADCVQVPKATVCSDSCDDVVVSNAGKARIEAALNDVASGVCATFTKDGCELIALPCDAPAMTAPGCEDGQCVAREPLPAGSCPSGCTPNAQDSCEGDPSCNGCPAHWLRPTSSTCTDSEQRCVYGGGCGSAKCDCVETDDGALAWSCSESAC